LTLVEDYHAAHKARLSRMGAPSPYQAPAVSIEKPPVKPQSIDAGWDCMWFYDLVQGVAEPRQIVPFKEVLETVCRYYRISMVDLLSDRRCREVTYPRQIAMYLCRLLTPHSFAEIGRRFGKTDHSTALHSSRKIEDLLGHDLKTISDVNTLRRVLA